MKIYESIEEFKELLRSMTPREIVGATEFGLLLTGNPDEDPSRLLTAAAARAAGSLTKMLEMTEDERKLIGVGGYAFAQYLEEHGDTIRGEIARLLFPEELKKRKKKKKKKTGTATRKKTTTKKTRKTATKKKAPVKRAKKKRR